MQLRLLVLRIFKSIVSLLLQVINAANKARIVKCFVMKITFALFFFLIIFSSVAQDTQKQKSSDSLIAITYSSFGMLGEFTLKLDQKDIFYAQTSRRPGNSEAIKKFSGKMSAYDWNELIYRVSQINLDSLSKLTSPTFDRASDGALYAKLRISTKSGSYLTQDFDEGIPMKEIWWLLFQIDQIINRHLINFKYDYPK
jgi:hypothetical protein